MPTVLDATMLETLRESAGGDAEFLNELLDTFLGEATQLLTEAQQALARGEAAALRRAAHSLKSSSASFGALAFSELCATLEGLAKNGQLAEAAELLTQAQAEYAQTQIALEAWRKEIG